MSLPAASTFGLQGQPIFQDETTMITFLSILGALLALGLITHGLWVLAYARSGQCAIDERLKDYVQR
ncbi:MAG: hypothetical protein JNK29_04615 [Anaerolineales bacterium]|nr:hypothetical protein [Anaerolineales bacterium]